MTDDDLAAADAVCQLAGVADLFVWLEVEDPALALDALRARRRELQAQQANPKHRDLAKRVIGSFRRLEAVLAAPDVYAARLGARRAAAGLPLLDVGVDGVLADGAVTEEELRFLTRTAERLGLDGAVALARLKERARQTGVSLQPPPRAAVSPEHPLLPAGWWDGEVARWIDASLPPMGRLVEPRGAHAALALTLAPRRPGLSTVCFGTEAEVAQAERAFERARLARAAALPGVSTALPLEDGSVDGAGFVLGGPTAAELAEARRVVREGGCLFAIDVGPPAVVWRGPCPELDSALGELWASLAAPAPLGGLAVKVVVTPYAGDVAPLAAEVRRRAERAAGAAGLGERSGRVKRARAAAAALAAAGAGEGWIAVPVVLRVGER